MTPTQHGNIAAAYIMRISAQDMAEINHWLRIWAQQSLNGNLSGTHEACNQTHAAITTACQKMGNYDRETIERIINQNRGEE
jgi:hypothetical protein